MTVHSRWCPNVRKLLYSPEREIEVRWADGAQVEPSRVTIQLTFEDRPGFLADVSQAIAEERGNIVGCQLRAEGPDQHGTATIMMEVRDAAHLDRILARIRTMDDVLEVVRQGLVTGVGP